MPKQLNVRSDEAVETARTLAKRLGTTTTDVVVQALRRYAAERTIPSTKVTAAEAEANYRAIMRSVRRAAKDRKEGGWSDKDLYDDNGLPK